VNAYWTPGQYRTSPPQVHNVYFWWGWTRIDRCCSEVEFTGWSRIDQLN